MTATPRPVSKHVAAASANSAIAVLAALLLAACSGAASGPKPGDPGVERAPESGGEPSAQSAARTPDDAAIDADAKRLIGLDHAGLTAILGEPEFRRKDAPAEFWRYRGERCMLDLFLYEPEQAAAADRRALVSHVEARALADGRVTATDCLRALLRARTPRPAG